MTMINQKACKKETGFVRQGSFNPGQIKYIFLSFSDADLLTNEELEDPETALQARMVSDAYKNSIFLIGELGVPEQNGEGVTYQTRGQKKLLAGKGTHDKIYTLVDGTWCQYQQLQQLLDGTKGYITFVDDANVAMSLQTGTGVRGMKGHEVHMLPYDEADTANAATYKVRISLANIDDWTKNAVHFDLGFDVSTLQGVEDVLLKDITPDGAADGVHIFSATGACEGCGEFNLADIYSTELTTAGAILARNGSNATITLTSVQTYAQNGKIVGLQANVSLADTDYVDGEPIYFKLAAPSVLAGAPYNMKYFRSNSLKLIAREA